MRRFRRRIVICCALAVAALGIGIAGFFVVYGNMKARLTENITELEAELAKYDTKSISALCAKDYIEAGSVITEDILEPCRVSEDTIPENTILVFSDAVGKTAKIPILKKTYITESMLYDTAPLNSEREIEYSCIEIGGNIRRGSYVDVRICFEDGADFIVLAQKRIEGISEDRKNVILHVDEEELLKMGSALTVQKEYEMTRIYAVEYPQGDIQAPSEADYVPSEVVAELIRKKNKTEGR